MMDTDQFRVSDIEQFVEEVEIDDPELLLGIALSMKAAYEQSGDKKDIDLAVVLAQRSTYLPNDNEESRPIRFNILGILHALRYERTGELEDLELAITYTNHALTLTLLDDPFRAIRLNNLGNMLFRRYERTYRQGDLQEAICAAKEAIDLAAPDDPERAGFFSNLAIKLFRRYERTGQTHDLTRSITAAKQATELAHHDDPNRPPYLSNLANSLLRRYERMGELEDLEEGLRAAKEAVDSIPQWHRDRAMFLNNLAVILTRRFERTEQMDDLETGIKAARQAAESTQQSSINLCNYLDTLGNMLEIRYDYTDQIDYLEEAIMIGKQALNLSTRGTLRLPGCANNLANKLLRLFERTGDERDLEGAINSASDAMNLTPLSDPLIAGRLHTLGLMLLRRYNQTGEMSDLDGATSRFLDAWHSRNAIPFHRVRAGARCLELLATQGSKDVAIQLGKEIIDFLPAVNTRLVERADQQYVVSTFAGVAANLCGFLLDSERPNEALSYLEKGRAVIIGHVVDARSDLALLTKHHPNMSDRFKHLRNEVNTTIHGGKHGEMDENTLPQHRDEALTQLEACIVEIRRMPGYERFLLGQTTTEMRQCAIGGHIAVVNIIKLRSDVILVSASDIKHIHLPLLTASDAEVWLGKNWRGERWERPQKNKEYQEYLIWLWNVCVKQVIDQVRNYNVQGDDLPRIWWIGTGLATSMPFHAAGKHSRGATQNSLSSVISSYTPSIKALAYSKRRSNDLSQSKDSLLITTMPTTPSSNHASGRKPADLRTVDEKQRVIESNSHMPIVDLQMPSVEQVVDCLKYCSFAHFACHGYTDRNDPSNSGLILQRRANEDCPPQQDQLTVRRVSELILANARIAYLSACSTAENRAARLTDEVLHVVSGFQLAGFPHVVGCLWQSNDRVCVQVASQFYSLLHRENARVWDDRGVAVAVHESVLAARATDLSMPLLWAPFVHYGA